MMGSESSHLLTAACCPAASVWTIGTTTSLPVLITNCDICASCVSAPNWCRILDGYAATLSISDKIVRRGLTSVDGGPTHLRPVETALERPTARGGGPRQEHLAG